MINEEVYGMSYQRTLDFQVRKFDKIIDKLFEEFEEIEKRLKNDRNNLKARERMKRLASRIDIIKEVLEGLSDAYQPRG